MTAQTTVLMPAYNAEETIAEAVESVLAQTVPDVEVVVADDASSIPMADVLAGIRDPRLRVIRRERRGGEGRARNSALAVARTPFVSQLDADDLWEPEYLEAVLPEFEDPGVGLVYTNATIIGHPDGLDDYIGDPSIHPRDRFPELAVANPVPSPTVTMRADALRDVGGYPWRFKSAADWHAYMRLAAAGWRFAYVDRRLARYRWPTPDRGMSYDVRSLERSARIALVSIALQHPRLPGIWSTLFARLRHGADHGAR